MKNKNHLCFDLDGVLIDSIDLMKYCWENTANRFNIANSFEEFSSLIGLPLTSITNYLNLSNSNEIIEHYKKLSYENLEKIKIHKDTISILNSLSKNYKLSIYTSKTQERVEKILDLFFKSVNFDLVLASDDVLHPKPKPDGLIKICVLVNSTLEETIYIGDTIYDFEASREAGVDFIYASWGYGKVENFKYKIVNLKELLKIV